jgi:hypothetical protein
MSKTKMPEEVYVYVYDYEPMSYVVVTDLNNIEFDLGDQEKTVGRYKLDRVGTVRNRKEFTGHD